MAECKHNFYLRWEMKKKLCDLITIFASLPRSGTESVVPLRSAWIELPGSGTWGTEGGAHCLGHLLVLGEAGPSPLGRDSPLPISEGLSS